MAGVEFGRSVYVPSQGWVVFGQLGNNLDTAQVLPTVDGEWKAGPNISTQLLNDSFCVVQVFFTF